MKLIDTIESPELLKTMGYPDLRRLAAQLRGRMVRTLSKNGGHLASNLGVVELTLALHRVFRSPEDKIVWDVGHQCYVHKLLTGRAADFATIRQRGGISGFPKPCESPHDAFVAGHSSTSISAALGLAKASELSGKDDFTIAVIGDGALTGGMAYEGLINAGKSPDTRIIVVLNDNEMSISKNESAIAKYLANIRSKPAYFRAKDSISDLLLSLPVVGESAWKMAAESKNALKRAIYDNTFFEELGFSYLGPVDGHNIRQLCEVFDRAKSLRRPVFVHVCTQKGKGYPPAEQMPDRFHGVSKFSIATGAPKSPAGCTFSKVFGEALCELAAGDDRVAAITAAMCDGTGLADFEAQFPERFFDVGIAEEHAVTFGAGLSAAGMLPVFAVYSTFLQRCYDQLIHDASIQPQNLLVAVDRAGVVGEDGETHQGLFDVGMLRTIPGMTIWSPAYHDELRSVLPIALHQPGLKAVRFPRGGEPEIPAEVRGKLQDVTHDEAENADTLIIGYGRVFAEVLEAGRLLRERGIPASLLRILKIWPLPDDVAAIALRYRTVLFAEEGMRSGGIGEVLGQRLLEHGFTGRYLVTAAEGFVPQGTPAQQLQMLSLDGASLSRRVVKERLV